MSLCKQTFSVMLLPYLIHDDQFGFMKGRQITQNLSQLLTIIDYCKHNDIEAVITSVDFEKAFDTVSWSAMRRIFKSYNFSDKFITPIMACYEGFQVNVGNNGHFTENLQIYRGNKQGCLISALNFLLVIETVGAKLRQDPRIKPIEINGIKKLLSQYADDLWTATKFERISFNAQFDIFQRFQDFTGLVINYNKTEIMRIGSMVGANAEIYTKLPLIWSDGSIKVLGVLFYPDIVKTTKENFAAKFEKIQSISKVWSQRSLSLIGKIQIVNTLMVSQLLYIMQCLPSPGKIFYDQCNVAIREFIWDKRKSKVSLERLQ